MADNNSSYPTIIDDLNQVISEYEEKIRHYIELMEKLPKTPGSPIAVERAHRLMDLRDTYLGVCLTLKAIIEDYDSSPTTIRDEENETR